MKRCFIFVVLIFLPFSIFSKYFKGDYTISLRIPLSIPAFTSLERGDTTNHVKTLLAFSQTGYKNIQAGVEIDFGYFLQDKLSLGGIIGYNFAYDRADRLISKVPILFKANYIIFSQGIFEVPVSFCLGINYWKYYYQEHFVLQAGLEFGLNVFWSDSWGALFRTGFWIYPELYADPYKTNVSGFIPIVVGVVYRR